jgi:hypothetical protein
VKARCFESDYAPTRRFGVPPEMDTEAIEGASLSGTSSSAITARQKGKGSGT